MGNVYRGYAFRIAIVTTVLLLTGTVVSDAAMPAADEAPSSWWDASHHFRLPVTVDAAGFERYEKPVEIDLNFTQMLAGAGQTGTLDVNSIRVIEVNSAGNVLNAQVPFQFDKDPDFNAGTKASGTVVFIMNGTTQAGGTRYYHIYFGLTGASYPPLYVAPLVTLTDNIMDEGQLSYQIEASGSTYYFQKQGGGFSSLVDASGNDWISYNDAAGSAGAYRGIPNAVNPEGYFHPGFNCCTSNIVTQGPLKTRIRSVSGDGNWESIWDIYPRYATMNMTKAGHGYWMLYEGTPGGAFEPDTDFMVRPDGNQTLLSQSWYGDIKNEEWVYFSDPNIGRSLFVAHHEDDTLQDEYWPHDNMTVFGFGRTEQPLAGLISSVPQHFTIGLMDGTGLSQNSKAVYSAYKALTITKGAVEQYNSTSNGNISVISESRLTFSDSLNRQPAWSPGGQWIAFVSTRDEEHNWEMYKMNKNGEGYGLTKLTSMAGGSDFNLEPSWYPNNRILFSRGPGQYYEDIYVMNDDGSNVQQLTLTPGFDEYPDWSPDGSKIVYSSVNGDNLNGDKYATEPKQLWVMNADGSSKHLLNTIWGVEPAWSPDGTKIAFKSYANLGANIWVMDADGSNPKQLTFNSAATRDPDWSPDGRYIVYASLKDGDWEIFVMNADGTDQQQLTSNTGIEDNYPAWSPDGRYIAYASNRTGSEEIWVMEVAYDQSPPGKSYAPPAPGNLGSTTGNFWVNHTWKAGSVGITDSYNVSVNGMWTNGTTITYYNTSVGPHGWSNITVYAYKNSVGLSIAPAAQNVQVANNIPVLARIGNRSVAAGKELNFTVSAADEDADTLTYGTNATNGTLNHSSGVFSWTPGSGDVGTYVWSFSSSDNYGGVASETIAVTVSNVSLTQSSSGNSPSSGSSGGSGGGGEGGASGENYYNIEFKDRKELEIYKDMTTCYLFTSRRNPVVFVNITGNTSSSEIITTVEVLKNTSSLVKNPAPGTVYKNMNIWVGGSGFAVPKNIKSATIAFRVENSWLDGNALARSDIRLARWNGSKWSRLDTLEKTRDGNYTYFEAKTESFSHFAITGSGSAKAPTKIMGEEKVPAATANAKETQAMKAPAVISTPHPITGTPGLEVSMMITAVSMIITGLLAIYVSGRKRG